MVAYSIGVNLLVGLLALVYLDHALPPAPSVTVTTPAPGTSVLAEPERAAQAWHPAVPPVVHALPYAACSASAGPIDSVRLVWIGHAAADLGDVGLAIARAFDVNLTVRETDAATLGEVRAEQGAVVVALTMDYYTDPRGVYAYFLGYMCGSVGHVSLGPWTTCPLLVVVHEVGHALGYPHGWSDVMRDPLGCAAEAQLVEDGGHAHE